MLLVCVITFAICEALVRWLAPQITGSLQFGVDPQMGVMLLPGARGVKIGADGRHYSFVHNKRGLRADREFREEKINAFRILMLGDSYTYGLLVNDNQTFSYYLQAIFDRQGKAAEVINAGAPGKGTDYALKFFQRLGQAYHPDVTILWFFYNDFCDNARGDYYDIDEKNQIHPKLPFVTIADRFRTSRLGSWLLSWSHLANFLKNQCIWLWYKIRPNQRLYAAMFVNYPEGCLSQMHKNYTSTYLRALRQATKEEGGKLLVCYIPDGVGMESYLKTNKVTEYESAIKEITEKEGITFLSLTPVFARKGRDFGELYIPNDIHFSPYGNEYIAEYIAGYLSASMPKGSRE